MNGGEETEKREETIDFIGGGSYTRICSGNVKSFQVSWWWQVCVTPLPVWRQSRDFLRKVRISSTHAFRPVLGSWLRGSVCFPQQRDRSSRLYRGDCIYRLSLCRTDGESRCGLLPAFTFPYAFIVAPLILPPLVLSSLLPPCFLNACVI